MHKRPRSPYVVLACIASGLLSVIPAQPAAQRPTKTVPANAVQRSKKAVELLNLAMAKSDERIPKALMTKAVAVAVINDMKTIGFLIEGGGQGDGVVTRRFSNGKWSPPTYIRMHALSIGLQLNARSFNVILLFMNDKAADWLLDKRSLTFDRSRAPVAGPVGEINTEQNEVVPVADVFSYVFDDGRLQSKDLKNMLKNFGISFDNNLNKATYGATAREILGDASGEKLKRLPTEVTIFSEAVAQWCAAE